MKFLFVKSRLAWPRSSGHDVITYGIMKALGELGHSIGLMTRSTPLPEAIAGLPLEVQTTFNHPGSASQPLDLRRLEQRYCSYWGIDDQVIQGIAGFAHDWNADVVVSVDWKRYPILRGKIS